MADNAAVNPVKVFDEYKPHFGVHCDRSIRGIPLGPASARHGIWPLSMQERVGFRVSHTISAGEKRRIA